MMKKIDAKGMAQTVLGLVNGEDLGVTMPHEHLFVDMRCWLEEPSNPEEKKLAHEKVTLNNLWFARYNKMSCEDNLILDDVDLAIKEAFYFKEAGGNTIVDVTSNNINRNPEGLVMVAKETGLNIIMGTSYYIASSYTPEMEMKTKSETEIAKEFIRDIAVGVGNTEIKAGIIGEIGTSWPLNSEERKVLIAAGLAQQETGVAINIHPGAHREAPFEYVKILEEVGADLSRVIISHMGRTFPPSARMDRAKLAEKGCYLEFDMFYGVYTTPKVTPYDVTNDTIQITEIKELIQDGFLNQILISRDVCYKVMLRSYGDGGYAHILKVILPRMKLKGISDEEIQIIIVENPRSILTF